MSLSIMTCLRIYLLARFICNFRSVSCPNVTYVFSCTWKADIDIINISGKGKGDFNSLRLVSLLPFNFKSTPA